MSIQVENDEGEIMVLRADSPSFTMETSMICALGFVMNSECVCQAEVVAFCSVENCLACVDVGVCEACEDGYTLNEASNKCDGKEEMISLLIQAHIFLKTYYFA